MKGEQPEFLKKKFQIPSLQKFNDEEETVWFGYHLAGGRVLRGAYFPWDLAAAEKISSIDLTDYIFESIDKRDKDAARLLNSIFNYVRAREGLT